MASRQWAVVARGIRVFSCPIKEVSQVYAASFNAAAKIHQLRVRAAVRRVR